MKLIFFLLLSCLTFAQEVRFQKDGDTTNIYNTGLTTPAEIVAGRKSLDSLFLNKARFKDNVDMDSTLTINDGISVGRQPGGTIFSNTQIKNALQRSLNIGVPSVTTEDLVNGYDFTTWSNGTNITTGTNTITLTGILGSYTRKSTPALEAGQSYQLIIAGTVTTDYYLTLRDYQVSNIYSPEYTGTFTDTVYFTNLNASGIALHIYGDVGASGTATITTFSLKKVLNAFLVGHPETGIYDSFSSDTIKTLLGIGEQNVYVKNWMPNDFPTDGTGDISPYVDLAMASVYTNQQVNNIVLPAGMYKANLTVSWNVHLIGSGGNIYDGFEQDATTLIPSKDNDTIITVSNNATQASIEHINFYGYNSAGDTAHIGIFFNASANFMIEDLTFYDFHNTGVAAKTPNAGTCIYVYDGHSIKQNLPMYMQRVDYGIYLFSVENFSLDRARVLYYYKAGIYLEQCNNTILYNPDCENTAVDTTVFTGFMAGIWMEGSHRTHILYPYLESTGADSSCAIYSGQKLDVSDLGWSNDFILKGGDIKFVSLDPARDAIVLSSTRNIVDISDVKISVYFPSDNVKPVDVAKSYANYVGLSNVKFTRQSTAQTITLNIDRYTNENWGDYSDYSTFVYSSEAYHYDQMMNSRVRVSDYAGFSKIGSLAFSNSTIGQKATALSGVIVCSGTGSTSGRQIYQDPGVNDTIIVTITMANHDGSSGNVYMNLMDVDLSLRWGGYAESTVWFGKLHIWQVAAGDTVSGKLNYGLTIDTLFGSATAKYIPGVVYTGSTDSTLTFQIRPASTHDAVINFFGQWENGTNIQTVTAWRKNQ